MVSGLFITLATCAFRKAHKNLQSTMFWQTRLKIEFCSCCGWCFMSKSTIPSCGCDAWGMILPFWVRLDHLLQFWWWMFGKKRRERACVWCCFRNTLPQPFPAQTQGCPCICPSCFSGTALIKGSLFFLLWRPEVSDESLKHMCTFHEQYIS